MRIFREKNLLILGLAESVSGIGDWITMMAVLAMLVFRGGGGVMESSGVFLAGLLPTLIVSPLAGWLVDRVNRRTLLDRQPASCRDCGQRVVFRRPKLFDLRDIGHGSCSDIGCFSRPPGGHPGSGLAR